MNTLYFDCIGGASGDMILASMIDLGLDIDYLKAQLDKLNIAGYSLDIKKSEAEDIDCIKLDINIDKNTSRFKDLSNIEDVINKSSLSDDIKSLSLRIFTLLAKAEAKVHGTSYEKVIFHQLADLDTLIDIVGFSIGVDYFKIDNFSCSRIKLGTGLNNTSHHKIPIPAPAVLSLLKNFNVELTNLKDELVTPTAAAIISATVKEQDKFPVGNIIKIGYGVGSKKLEVLNLFRSVILEENEIYEKDSVTVLETNIDDMSPEGVAHLLEELNKAGALDAYITNVSMKKSRPGFLITVLSEDYLAGKLSSLIYSESTTLGIRYYKARRNKLRRNIKEVDTKFGKVKVKIAEINDSKYRISPEYEDCKKKASKSKVSFRQVYDEAKNNTKII